MYLPYICYVSLTRLCISSQSIFDDMIVIVYPKKFKIRIEFFQHMNVIVYPKKFEIRINRNCD